jgi:hypothetical protein
MNCATLEEITALNDLFYSTNGASWYNKTNWPSDSDPCIIKRFGVQCLGTSLYNV